MIVNKHRTLKGCYPIAVTTFCAFCLSLMGCRHDIRTSSLQEQASSPMHSKLIKSQGYPVDMMFIDPDHGWIAYEKSLWKTNNGGIDWILRKELFGNENPLLDEKFLALFFLDKQLGWIVLRTQVLKTTDGGESWITILHLNALDSINDIFFLDSDRGWMVGSRFNNATHTPVLLYTYDGGKSWQQITSLRDGSIERPYGLELHGILFLNSDIGWASGNGVIWRTKDNGSSWKRIKLKIGKESDVVLSKLQFIDEMQGYAKSVPVRGAAPHYLVKTTDGGYSWEVINIPAPSPTLGLSDFHFLDSKLGLVIYQGELFRTEDGGQHWKKIELVDTVGFGLIRFPSKLDGFISGKDGLFLRTTDAGINWKKIE